MIVFAFPPYTEMGNELCLSLLIEQGHCSIDRFPNGEVHASIETPVVNEKCLILGTIAPPDEQLLSLLLLSHTLKKENRRGCCS